VDDTVISVSAEEMMPTSRAFTLFNIAALQLS